MDRSVMLNELKQAESRVRQGASTLVQQESVLAELRAHGHDTRMAERLYRSFAALQDCYLENRAQLTVALARAEKTVATTKHTELS